VGGGFFGMCRRKARGGEGVGSAMNIIVVKPTILKKSVVEKFLVEPAVRMMMLVRIRALEKIMSA
jgi:hypothetical protein